ncbi:MAG: aryl-sulfate sulfotransferase [Saprospiraceae bacterium]
MKLKPLLLFLAISFYTGTSISQTMGIFLNDSLSVNGYTLFTVNKITYLIDNCGFEVNRWVSNYQSNSAIYLLENGNLLRTGRVSGSFSGGGIGGRIELFNWEGDLLWAYDYATADYHQHHDIEPMPNGNILILAWEAITT